MRILPGVKAVIFANSMATAYAFAVPSEVVSNVRTLQELYAMWSEKATVEDPLSPFKYWSERPATEDKPYALIAKYFNVWVEVTENEIVFSILGGDSDKVLAKISVKFEGKKRVTIVALDIPSLEKRHVHMYLGALWEADQKLGGVIMDKIQRTSQKSRIRYLLIELYKQWVIRENDSIREAA